MRLIALFSLFLLFGCTSSQDWSNVNPEAAKVKYATGFSLGTWEGMQTITVERSFKDAQSSDKYLLVPRDSEIQNPPQDHTMIRVPVKRIIATSTTHLAAFELIGAADRIIGFPGAEYIYSKKYIQNLNDNKLLDLGNEMKPDFEKIISLEPDLFMGYTLNGDLGQYDLLNRANIPLFLNAEYLESTPLGRAEWIRVAGLLTGRLNEADSVFAVIEENYKEKLAMAEELEPAPTVISGVMYQGTWYMPGGQSWAAIYFKDAGAQFPWEDDENSGSIPLSLETVLDVGIDADYWIGTSSATTLSELLDLDQRYGEFEALKQGNVYNYSRRVNKNGGNDYFEMAIMRPDLVLGDLVNIFSEDTDTSTLHYFEKLKDDRE